MLLLFLMVASSKHVWNVLSVYIGFIREGPYSPGSWDTSHLQSFSVTVFKLYSHVVPLDPVLLLVLHTHKFPQQIRSCIHHFDLAFIPVSLYPCLPLILFLLQFAVSCWESPLTFEMKFWDGDRHIQPAMSCVSGRSQSSWKLLNNNDAMREISIRCIILIPSHYLQSILHLSFYFWRINDKRATNI